MMTPIKHAAYFLNGAAFKPSDWGDDGLPILRIAQLTGKAFDNYFDGKINRGLLIEDGDLLFSWSATIDAFLWSRGDAVLNQHIFKVVAKPNADKLYLYYLIKAHAPRWADEDAHGSTIRHIKKESLSNKIWLPDLSTQKLIASFLDRETEQIDELIAKKERLLEALDLRRLGKIMELTSGECFLSQPLHRLYWVQTGKTPSRSEERYFAADGMPWATPVDLLEDYKITSTKEGISTAGLQGMKPVPRGTVLVNGIGAGVGKTGIAGTEMVFNQQIHALIPKGAHHDSAFLMYTLIARRAEMLSLANLNTIPILNGERIGRIELPIPELSTQERVVEDLNKEGERRRTINIKTDHTIDRLREYRAALITAAVTGQIDVDTYGKSGATSATLDKIEEEMQA